MKPLKFLIHFLIISIAFIACERPHQTIDPIFKWPVSGVREADSILLEYEIDRTSADPSRHTFKNKEKFCSIATLHKDNEILQFRQAYLEICDMHKIGSPLVGQAISEAQSKIDSAKYPFDWHMMNSLKIEGEQDILKKYYLIVDNIAFFKKIEAHVEMARHLTYLGNLMHNFHDEKRALDAHKEAERIYDSLNLIPNLIVARLNIPLAYSKKEADSIYMELRKDSIIRSNPMANVQLMQNSFIRTDSLTFLDEAISTYRNSNIPKRNLPMLLAFKGDYLTRHGDPQKGLDLIEEAFELVDEKPYYSRYLLLMHYFKANTLFNIGMQDSAKKEFERAWRWRDSLDRELNRPGVYALDARTRIEMTERTGRLEQVRLIYLWIISILMLIIIIMIIIYQSKKRIEEKRKKEQLMEEDIRRNHQSILAQASVMEQSDNLISEITASINTLKEREEIDKETADTLMKTLRIHKSNEENRQGFLKVQQELDTRFMTRLKDDFPTLSESQLRLASLIAVGVDSRQIGSILNIEQASVHKSRYRLRTRLGLKTDDSLEDFLRRYNNPPE